MVEEYELIIFILVVIKNGGKVESARERNTKNGIEASQLRHLSFVDPNGYICKQCNVTVTPCSYHTDNKKRPYFRVDKNGHEDNCDMKPDSETIKKIRSGSSANSEGKSLDYPSKLLLRNTKTTADANSNTSAPVKKSISVQAETSEIITNKPHHSTTGQIQKICNYFIENPSSSKRKQSLVIPGVSSRTYRTVFRRLEEKKIIPYTKRKIFYAPLSWTASIENKTENYLEILLNYGRWEQKKLIPYRVRFYWQNWGNDAKKTSFFEELEFARLKTVKTHEKKNEEKGWLFFVGEQEEHGDEDQLRTFHVRDERLICYFIADVLHEKSLLEHKNFSPL